MASPSGTYVIMASNTVGSCTVTINYDDTQPNKPLINRGTPPTCLVADNSTDQPWPYYVQSSQGLLDGTIPIGNTDLSVAQINARSGITDLSSISFGLGAFPG